MQRELAHASDRGEQPSPTARHPPLNRGQAAESLIVTDTELAKCVINEVDAFLCGVVSVTVLNTFPQGMEPTLENLPRLWEAFEAVEKDLKLPQGFLRSRYQRMLTRALNYKRMITGLNMVLNDTTYP